jgi:hypothetical protein
MREWSIYPREATVGRRLKNHLRLKTYTDFPAGIGVFKHADGHCRLPGSSYSFADRALVILHRVDASEF